MKRLHLFEFEDLSWFPHWIRVRMTRLLVVMHKMLNTEAELSELIARILKETKTNRIIDLCSGAGGPMLGVIERLEKDHSLSIVELTMTDLYPNKEVAESVNSINNRITYGLNPIDATQVGDELKGLRTMVSGFHHMKPEGAKKILKSAIDAKQPICIFEISDNGFPSYIWWIAIPFNFISCLFITPMARPMSWQQIIFTYLIPIIPFCFAWDGAVSNARTYTLDDLAILTDDLKAPNYKWESGIIKGKSKKIYLLGMPI